ncbi:MAG: three-Cys-motif partner protein TcmP [Planctomycetes bacterium]|nr:three-Cys-motif partner protein TcmP [Planctomycetota bacterium]
MAKTAEQQFGGDWTERKLSALTAYLEKYTQALSKQSFKLEYIDAFAGTGYREMADYREQQAPSLFADNADEAVAKYLDGSAAKALQISRPFHRYVFVELSEGKSAKLGELKQRFPALADRVEVVQSDANAYLAGRAKENWLKAGRRAVVFVDPFGMQVDWTTIEGLAKTKAVDLWLLYPVSAINRLLSRGGVRLSSWKARLDKVFGGPEWFDSFYRKSKKSSLFEGVAEDRFEKVINIDGLTNFMVSKLQRVFAEVVEKPLVLRSNNDTPLFALCFAAANPAGAPIACKIAKHILEK